MSYASIVKCEITTVFSSGVGSAKSNICNISSVVDVHTRKHLFKVMRSCASVVLCTVCNPFFNEKIYKILNVKTTGKISEEPAREHGGLQYIE
jgi:hypothetical protein